jgi:cytochrome c553
VPPPIADREVDFARDVRPLLDKHCISCHGIEKQEAGLRLDQRQAAMTGGDSGKSIVPGNSAESRLIEYVAGVDPDLVMPPEGQRLSAEEIGLLRAWIERGATWPDVDSTALVKNEHWAYQPIKVVKPPTVTSDAMVHNSIDQFVIANLQAHGLAPSPEADRRTLIRRLSLDLLGLLPTIDEVDAFVADTDPMAYEKLVDRLLQSPHFGERWGRHWLDMARYADSDGYEKDNARPDAYRWRDWVIEAINDDMPFDQFTLEQLAGDLLPDATNMQRLATAFHRQTLTNTEGGTDQEQFRVEACFDRTETTGAVWLGLTVGCARCHSHKYDAITQREYYQLFSFFNNGDEQTHVVPKSVEEVQQYNIAKAKHDAKVQALSQELTAAQKQLGPTLVAWEADAQATLSSLAAKPLNRHSLTDPAVSGEAGVTFELQKDGSYLVSGTNPATATYTLTGATNTAFDTIRLEALSDKTLPKKGPGRVAHGNFVLSEITVEFASKADFSDAVPWELVSARADHEQSDKPWLAKHAIDGDASTGWAIAPEFGKDHWIEVQLKPAQAETATRFMRITLKQLHGQQHTLGRFGISLQAGFSPEIDLPQGIVDILAVPEKDRTEKQKERLLEHVSRIAPATKPIVEQLDELNKQEPAKPELSVRVIAQRTKEPRETFVLRRGEFLEPLKDSPVQPAGFSTLPPMRSRDANAAADRLDLAQWLVSPQNPLTPRVTVNHIWRHLFGAGIVKTANDFGVRGDPPTHPELLDWLAAEFIGLNARSDSALTSPNAAHIPSSPKSSSQKSSSQKSWSRKSLIKLICMSSTYRQSSQQSAEMRESDPQNQWLGRQNRLRVEGEIIRDISLQVAGLLSPKIGGPSVYPSLPEGVAELSYAGNFKWTLSPGADQYRRGMYTFFKRTSPHPNLLTFDCPDANLTCIDRNVSNTPLQALVALNNASFAEAARALASRLFSLPGEHDDASRLTNAFEMCLARTPNRFELEQLLAHLASARTWYAAHESEAQKMIDSAAVSEVAPTETAAWIATARLLINLDEFITRE